jgi:predicted nicotinamide N-methyase
MSPDKRDFVRTNTVLAAPPLVPELKLHLATEITSLWQATEASLAQSHLPPPYWAFAWAGGQALARHLLDHPDLARGLSVLDVGAGSGLVAIAAAKAGAASVTASDPDPFAAAAIEANAAANGVSVAVETADIIGAAPTFDVVLAGDMCYERPLAERLVEWLGRCADAGALVLLGDPGRAYLPKTGLEALATYQVETPLELEDRTMRETTVWRLTPPALPRR